MQRLAMLITFVVGLTASAAAVVADEPTPTEKELLERFWRDYYDGLKRYYGAVGSIDWVAYYKNHAYPINPGCRSGRCARIQCPELWSSPPQLHWTPSPTLQAPPGGIPPVPPFAQAWKPWPWPAPQK